MFFDERKRNYFKGIRNFYIRVTGSLEPLHMLIEQFVIFMFALVYNLPYSSF